MRPCLNTQFNKERQKESPMLLEESISKEKDNNKAQEIVLWLQQESSSYIVPEIWQIINP